MRKGDRMARNTSFDLVRGYTSDQYENSGKKFYAKAITGSARRANLTRFGKYISMFFDRMTELLSYSSTRMYGSLFSVFGGLSLIIHLVMEYVGVYDKMPPYILIVSGVFLLLGIAFLIVDLPISTALQSFKLTDFIFFEFFCIRRMHKLDNKRGIHFIFGIVIGAMLAVIGALVPFYAVVIVLGVFAYLFLTFLSPEFSFFSIFIAMPYLSFDKDGIFLAMMVLVTILSFARKVTLGKRVYFFEQYDAGLFLMLVCILISGIFVKGVESFVSSVVMITLGGGYILASSLVTNRRLADCLINAVIVSAIPISFIAIIEASLHIAENGIYGYAGATATFDKPYTLAMFLLISGTFSLYFVSARRRMSAKVLYAVLFVINLVALFFTMSMWSFAVAVFGLAAFGVSKLKHVSQILVVLVVISPYLLLFIPSEQAEAIVMNPAFEAMGVSESMERWYTSMEMLKDNLFLGIGIGEDCFAEEILKYTDSFSYSNSGNFMLELACEAGVISLVAFLLICLIRVRHRAVYQPYIKNSQVSILADFTTVSTVCLIVYGAFNYIWADMTMYYLFWCIFGLGSAALRVSKQEFDDRVAYFSDARAEDTSSIDISIK